MIVFASTQSLRRGRRGWAIAAAVVTLLAAPPSPAAHAQVFLRAIASSSAHQGPTVVGSTATLENGVLTTSQGPGGGASGSPTGWPATEANVFTNQPGSASGQTFSNNAQASANLLTGVLRGASASTPLNNFGTPLGVTESRLEDTVYFVNPGTTPVAVSLSWTVGGLIVPNTSGPPGAFEVTGTLVFSSTPSHPMPVMQGTAGGTQAIAYRTATAYRTFWNPISGAVFALGAGPIWTIANLGTSGAVMGTTFSLPPGVSAIALRARLDIWCNGGMTCDFSSPGAVIGLGTLPAGVLMASESGAFLGAPPLSPVPAALTVTSVVGNRVSLRWNPPTGAVATGYVIEGGVAPSQVMGSLPTGGTGTTFSFDAPTGSFYLRVHAVTASGRSGPSNEILVHVNVPQPPSAPAALLGLVNGSALGLSWRNTATGGTPTSMVLDVTGAVNASLPLPVGETFSFAGVPPGTYTFAVRTLNAVGASAASPGVTLTFPGGCSGAPAPPTNFAVTRTGNVLSLQWDPPATGTAVSGYVLDVSGAVTLALPMTGRSLSSPVPPGSYTFRVRSTNACGQSADTAPQAVTVP